MTGHEEERLRDTIRAVVRAGGEPVPWTGVTQRASSPRRRPARPYRPLAAAAAALAVVVSIVAVAAIATRPGPEVPADLTEQRVEVPHRVLAEGVAVGVPLSVGIVTRLADQRDLLADLGIDTSEVGAVNLAQELVLRFTASATPGCPVGEVVGLSYDTNTGVLAPEFATPEPEPEPEGGPVRTCIGMVGGPHTVLLAVQRVDLPAAPFTLWIDHDPSPGVMDRVLTVDPDDLVTVPVVVDPTEERPILTLGSFAWAIPDINWPIDAHVTVVYADGRVIGLRAPPDSTREVSAEQGYLAPQQLEALVELAIDAGLAEPGVQPSEPLPASRAGGIMDGGYVVLTVRTGDGVGVAAVDQPYGAGQPPSDATPRRVLLERLTSVVGRVAWDAQLEPVSLTRWAVQSAGPMRTFDPERWPWPDLDPGSLDWSFNEFGVRCAIVERVTWPYDDDERFDWEARVSGIYRRPLMPHERDCDDVFAWREELGIAAGVTFPHPPDVLPRD